MGSRGEKGTLGFLGEKAWGEEGNRARPGKVRIKGAWRGVNQHGLVLDSFTTGPGLESMYGTQDFAGSARKRRRSSWHC